VKKLAYIIMLSNLLLLGCEHDLKYTKDTCHRRYYLESPALITDKDRQNCSECRFSRWEVYDKNEKRYIAHIAYDPFKCFIEFLRVDEGYKEQGIGKKLAYKAIKDMRIKYNCEKISLRSSLEGEKFWEKLGAQRNDNDGKYYFSNS
jgi:predicted GNAT family acetyltransferase